MPTVTSPTLSPATPPSAQLIVAPTDSPGVAPSAQPVDQPTAGLPSVSPVVAPSIPPVVPPTVVPSVAPSLFPSAQPSVDPYPTKTEISFQCDMIVSGTDKTTFVSDSAAQQAVITAFAAGMNNTSADQVSITNITDVTTSRRLSHADRDFGNNNLRAGVRVSATGIAITLEVRRLLEELDLTANDAAVLYATMSEQASTAVTTGDFTARLTARLEELGSMMSLTPQTESFRVGNFTLRVLATPVPSMVPVPTPTAGVTAPTVPPSVAPSGAAATADKATEAGLSLGAMVGIIVAAVLLGLGLAGFVYFRCTRHAKVTVSAD